MLSCRIKGERQAAENIPKAQRIFSDHREVPMAGPVLFCVFLSASTLFRPCISWPSVSFDVAGSFAVPHLLSSITMLLFECLWMLCITDNISLCLSYITLVVSICVKVLQWSNLSVAGCILLISFGISDTSTLLTAHKCACDCVECVHTCTACGIV